MAANINEVLGLLQGKGHAELQGILDRIDKDTPEIAAVFQGLGVEEEPRTFGTDDEIKRRFRMRINTLLSQPDRTVSA